MVKITADQVDRIYQYIKDHPGIGVKETSRQLAIGFTAVRFGVDRLVDAGKIKKILTANNRTVKLFVIEEE